MFPVFSWPAKGFIGGRIRENESVATAITSVQEADLSFRRHIEQCFP